MTQLEVARRDPRAHALAHVQGSGGRPRFSRRRLLHLSAWHYHREGLESALRYLEAGFLRNFKRVESLPTFMSYLRRYEAAYVRQGLAVVEAPLRKLAVPVGRHVLTGELSRLDLHPSGGYAGCIFVDMGTLTLHELRAPLVQWSIAERLGASLDEVILGTYGFVDGSYATTSFARSSIDAAFEEAEHVLDELVRFGWADADG